MNKHCTNSACRKTFSTLIYDNVCPFCGKVYPQLKTRHIPHTMHLWIDGKRRVFILDEIERFHREGRRVKGIRACRQEALRLGFFIPLKSAVAFYNSLYYNNCPIDRWKTTPELVDGKRRIEPVNPLG